jgi:hypothetical protein
MTLHTACLTLQYMGPTHKLLSALPNTVFEWGGKKYRFDSWKGADLEALSILFGHGGCACCQPCVLCLVTLDQLKNCLWNDIKGDVLYRTEESYAENYSRRSQNILYEQTQVKPKSCSGCGQWGSNQLIGSLSLEHDQNHPDKKRLCSTCGSKDHYANQNNQNLPGSKTTKANACCRDWTEQVTLPCSSYYFRSKPSCKLLPTSMPAFARLT